jgi:hypothetical protein
VEVGKLLKIRTVSWFSASALFLAIATIAVSGEKPIPSGKIAIQSKSLAFGLGFSWGDGMLYFAGREFRFSVNGVTMIDFGVGTASAAGDVYNLTDVGLFEGTYFAGEAAFALGGGMGGTALRNENGVTIHLRSSTQGVRFQLGGSGLAIKLEK